MRIAGSMVVVLGATSLFACKDAPPSRPPEAAVPTLPPVEAVDAAPPSAAATTSASLPTGPASDTCQTDADCTLSTFPGCCSCCPCGKLHAVTLSREASAKQACERKDCRSCKDFVGDCIACTDPTKEGMRARCLGNACTLVETKASATPAAVTAPVACKSDDDCWFDGNSAPIPRPAKERGKKIRPCKDGEHVPACKDGACMVHFYKC